MPFILQRLLSRSASLGKRLFVRASKPSTSRRAGLLVERLESRELMSGVTLITHGFQFSAGTPQWLTAMGNSISDQAGGASQYRLTLSPDGNSISKVGDQSIAVSSNPNGEIILLVDWSAWSNSFLHPLTYTDWVADQIMPALTGTFASIGIVNPLIEQPIHLIGHSRGGSLVSSLASKLALNDIWVDQLTTLDPDPVLADKYPDVPDNVSFADNYYQNTDNYLVTGLAVDGAAGIGPLNLPGGNPELLSGIASIGDHADVHTWYQGTIDTSANAADGVVTSIPSNWYTGNQGPRDSVGFAWSRIGGAKRPASGQALSGATRAATTVTATGSAAWDNVLIRNLQTSTDLKRGTAVELDTYVGDINRDSTLTFGFDFDSNPYNGTVSSNSWTTASISNTSDPVDLPNGHVRIVPRFISRFRQDQQWGEYAVRLLARRGDGHGSDGVHW